MFSWFAWFGRLLWKLIFGQAAPPAAYELPESSAPVPEPVETPKPLTHKERLLEDMRLALAKPPGRVTCIPIDYKDSPWEVKVLPESVICSRGIDRSRYVDILLPQPDRFVTPELAIKYGLDPELIGRRLFEQPNRIHTKTENS